MEQRATGSWVCDHCKFLDSYSNTIGDQMHDKKAQRFGRLVQSFGDFGELRQQKKAPKLEVFYIPVKTQVKSRLPGSGKPIVETEEILRSVNNCSSEQITDFIQVVGRNLEAGNLSQDKGETVLNYLYKEIERRVNNHETQKSQTRS